MSENTLKGVLDDIFIGIVNKYGEEKTWWGTKTKIAKMMEQYAKELREKRLYKELKQFVESEGRPSEVEEMRKKLIKYWQED